MKPIILIVDDEPHMRQLITLIVMDLVMEGMDGVAALKKLREQNDMAATPVIIVTTQSLTAPQTVGKDIQATTFLTKPFSPNFLLAEVNRLLKPGPVKQP